MRVVINSVGLVDGLGGWWSTLYNAGTLLVGT